jgi:hypothetical protein
VIAPLLLFALQTAAPESRIPIPSITGLNKPCPIGSKGEIIVCARRSEAERQRYRDAGAPPLPDRDSTPAGFAVSKDATIAAEVESFVRPDGTINKAIMVKYKLRF